MDSDICLGLDGWSEAGTETNLAAVQPSVVEVRLQQAQGPVPQSIEGEHQPRVFYGCIILEPQCFQLEQWPGR